MRVVSLGLAVLVSISFLAGSGRAAVLSNPDFETGDLSGWTTVAAPLSVGIDTNNTFNRNFSARIHGTYASATLITNSIRQSLDVSVGDNLQALGFVHFRTHDTSSAGATGYVRAALSGDFTTTSRVWAATNSWCFFDLRAMIFGIADPGFESGGLSHWNVTCNDLVAQVQATVVDTGSYSLAMTGMWSNKWSWNEVCQFVELSSGDVVTCSARMKIAEFRKWGPVPWAVAGIKLELGDSDFEKVFNATAVTSAWTNVTLTAVITNSGVYTYRCMICGDAAGGKVTTEVYFDQMALSKGGGGGGGPGQATLSVDYIGRSGGASSTSAVDVYVDSCVVKGSSSGVGEATNILTVLRAEAAAVGTNPLVSIPYLAYPYLFYFGYPGYRGDEENYPAYSEVGVAGWKFKWMTNNITVTATNTVLLYGLSTNGPGFIEIDQYRYVGKSAGKERGEPLELNTNAPYFTLGVKNSSSAEFGNGPFPPEHTYVVGTSLTNFPRRMTTDASGGWPSVLRIVFQENFSTNQFTNSLWQKYFVLATIPTNGPASNVKAMKMGLNATDSGRSNELEVLSHEIHMGWATEDDCYGHVDYPNLTYQAHNEVALRAGWLHNLLDQSGWYMAPSPRGSATIEPIDLFYEQAGNWMWRAYEEYLFTWENAGEGARSLFDDDFKDRLPGQASYFVGFKIGHENGTNAMGETQYPEVLNIRGNGYYRMTDYDGVMAGSFRPVAADIFGLFAGTEDAPLIPSAYVRLVPRTTPTNGIDDSHAEAYQNFRSKTNEWFVGTLKTDTHFAPSQVGSNGCYFDLEIDTWANQAVVVTNHGALTCFSQVSMHWRGGTNINDGTEGHDIDCVMVKKTDGEWVTHQVLNPYTNIYQRTLATFRNNDVAYLMQQDRGKDSYGFATEAPYRRASAFEITMLDDGGLPLNLDLYENSTMSEIADNVNITCQIDRDIAQGEHLHYKYRYRAVYAPGVYVVSPNDSDGGENWSTNRYLVEFFATDGHDEPLTANIYYGNGLDSDWKLINTNETLFVSTNTHKIAYSWDVSEVPPGAYYIKATARRTIGGKIGFDVSNSRLQVGPTYGFPENGTTNITVTTNAVGYLGTNMGFEVGNASGWTEEENALNIQVVNTKAAEGEYSARMTGSGWAGWSWNTLRQKVTCVSGEVLHVTGRVFIGSLAKSGVDWVACGIKMESTNEAGRTSAGMEFNQTATTGSWLVVDFDRTAPVTGTDELHLWCGGNDGTNLDIYFDSIAVASTNTGVVVTNGVRNGYWEGSAAVNVTNYNLLSFRVAGTYGAAGAYVWAKDAANVTNRVALTNFAAPIVSLPRRVDIPWTNFPTIDRTQVKAIGFWSPAVSNNLQASAMRATWVPLLARSRIASAPELSLEGLPHFNPGETITNVVTIENVSGTQITGVTIQAVQEYGETLNWWESSPGVPSRWSAYTRTGDRLCGAFENLWSNRTVGAGSAITLTNVYLVPFGHRVNHLRNNFEPRDWYHLRNYACRAQVDVTVRKSNGDNVYQTQGAGSYSMDDDYDIDNDGLPDSWEVALSGTYTGAVASADSDNDSFDNLSEYVAGTVATNRLSVPSADSVRRTSGGPLSIWFSTVTGRVYRVEWSPSLMSVSWQPVGTNLVTGTGGVESLVDNDSALLTNRYYRLIVKFADRAWPL